jgi:glycine cleavage system aminomethyltransferase T
LLRLREIRVPRRLIGLGIQDPGLLPLGREALLHLGEVVGLTTSAAFGHTLSRGIALGYLRTNAQDVRDMIKAADFEIESACQRFPAAASLWAFYDPNGERMKTDG